MGTSVAAVLSAEGKGWGEALSAFSAAAYGQPGYGVEGSQ